MVIAKSALFQRTPLTTGTAVMNDRKHADHLSVVFERLPAAVLVLDGEGRISEANNTANELLLAYIHGDALIGGLWRDVVTQCFQARKDDGHEISTRGGKRVNISTCPLESEPGQIILIKDVTESRSLQSSVARNERLASLGEMTASLAHQFRTPISSALLYASHLGGDQLPPEARGEFADKLISRLAHMEQLIQDMLVFARGGETRQPETLAVADMLDTALSAMDGRMNQSEVTIVYKTAAATHGKAGPLIQGDRDSLITAVHNLLDNAVKACGDHGLVTLTTKASPSHVHIQISDNGQGMDQSTINHVLEPFYTTSPGGTGLGLAVVNAVAQSHGGGLNIESTSGKGSCFTLTLPLAQQPSDTSSAVAAQANLNPSWINKHTTTNRQRPTLTSVN